MRLCTLLAAMLAAAALPARADTIGTLTTYDFSGACQDCTGTATAELTLTNYVPGSTIDGTNFVSFHYDGTNLEAPFTITAAQSPYLTGTMRPPYPAMEDFFITGNGQIFSSSVSGDWCVGGACLSDYGFTHSWVLAATAPGTAVPEPLGVALLATPLLLLTAIRRR